MNAPPADAPIYAQLIRERGDVPTDVRRTAEETLRDVERVLNWGPGLASGSYPQENFGRQQPTRPQLGPA